MTPLTSRRPELGQAHRYKLFLCELSVTWVLLLTFLGGAISLLWLAVLGEWRPLVWGIAVSAAMVGLGATLLELPSIGFGVAAGIFREKGWLLLAVPLWLMGLFYTDALMAAWCVGDFLAVIRLANHGNVVPLLIWSIAMAGGPWAYMGAWQYHHGDSAASSGLVEVALLQLCYLGLTVVSYGWGITFAGAMVFLGVTAITCAGASAALRGPGFLHGEI